VRYWRPCFRTPEGKLVVAPLPTEVFGHFGPNLRRFLLSQHCCAVILLVCDLSLFYKNLISWRFICRKCHKNYKCNKYKAKIPNLSA
jgi:hypothetical protein